MDKRIGEIQMEDGSSILFEVDGPPPPPGPVPVAVGAGGIIDIPQRFDEALTGLQGVAKSLWKQLGNFPERPDEVSVVLNVKLTAEGKLLVASTKGEASLQVTLAWKNRQPAGG